MNSDNLKKIIGEDTYKKIRNDKLKLDKINYKGLYSGYKENELFLPEENNNLEPEDTADKDSPVSKAYHAIQETLDDYNKSLDEKIKIGVISNGVHAFDFLNKIEDSDIDSAQKINWQSAKIMVVYEAPSNNLNCSFGFKKYNSENWCNINNKEKIKEYIEKKYIEKLDIKDCLTAHWWRVDDSDLDLSFSNNNDILKYFYQKEYSNFLFSLIKKFGLANVYATNLCRFELFSSSEGNEQFLNWAKTSAINNRDILDICFNEIFKKELEEFEPDLILATANPYKYLTGKSDFKYKEKCVKIIHPANPYVTNISRLYTNYCIIASALIKNKIVEDVEFKDLLEFQGP